MMSNWNRFAGVSALAVLAAALVAPTAIYAQETTAVVRGEVKSGATAIGGATVTVTHIPTGTKSTVRTSADGRFQATGLRVGGPFEIVVAANGYESSSASDLFLNAGEPYGLTVELATQAREVERVIVTGRAVGVAAADGAATTSLRRDAIVAVASINRDIRDIARRSPLATQDARGTGGISIAGSNPRTNRVTIDGTQAQDDFGLNTGGLPTLRGPISIDAIQQFSISATPFDVRNGGFLGGAIDIVLRGGTNNFSGSVFTNLLSDDLTGTQLQNTKVSNEVEQTNWGATLRGPIFKDRLFFALSYETYESIGSTPFGTTEGAFANFITGPTSLGANRVFLTQANIDTVTNIFKTNYNSTFDFGSIPLTTPILDEKYTARFDLNITDRQRASLTYRKSTSSNVLRPNLGATTAALSSSWYTTGEDDETYTAQLNSSWTDNFSTELRVSQRSYLRTQLPPSGQEFSDIRVCLTPTAVNTATATPQLSCFASDNSTGIGVVRFGPDQFRHANLLENQNNQVQFDAKYLMGSHTIKAGLQYQAREVFNLFVPNSDGQYYFDSVADFQAGRASQFIYNNNPSLDANKAAAAFEYTISSAYAQDTWEISDDFRVNYGVRFDAYASDQKPAVNAAFQARHGFTNEATYDGLSILMPRASFNWNATDNIKVTGGIGLFSGGLPDVFLSNAYSNTGVLTSQLDIRRMSNNSAIDIFEEAGRNAGFTQPIGALALNGLAGPNFGRSVPAAITAILGGAVPPPLNETASIDPNFDIPSDWKVNLAVSTTLPWDVEFDVDAVYTRVNTGLAFRDLRAKPLVIGGAQALTPDGRIRYSVPLAAGGNRDIQVYNPSGDLGEGFVVALSFRKELFAGFNAGISYTYQNLDELSNTARFGSTPGELYNSQFADRDPNAPASGAAVEEIRNSIKYSAEWRGNVFGDLETRVSLFGDKREGRNWSWVMSGGTGRDAIFGVNKSNHLAYVPNFAAGGTPIVTGTGANTVVTLPGDSLVSFDSLASYDRMLAIVNQFGLQQGGIIPRGTTKNSNLHLVDMKLSQQLPGLRRADKAFITFEISNLLNMINADWGMVEEFGDQTLYQATCANAAGLTSTTECVKYRISSVSDILSSARTPTRNTEKSRWQIQVGLRYEF
jgi:Carboxypeptidase regulatory-like domain/TonB dependent receptor